MAHSHGLLPGGKGANGRKVDTTAYYEVLHPPRLCVRRGLLCRVGTESVDELRTAVSKLGVYSRVRVGFNVPNYNVLRLNTCIPD